MTPAGISSPNWPAYVRPKAGAFPWPISEVGLETQEVDTLTSGRCVRCDDTGVGVLSLHS